MGIIGVEGFVPWSHSVLTVPKALLSTSTARSHLMLRMYNPKGTDSAVSSPELKEDVVGVLAEGKRLLTRVPWST